MHNADIAKIRILADQGDADAQYEIGEHYSPNDDELAVEWYRKAAEQGHVNAQYVLSWQMLNERDYTKAEKEESEKWERMAAEGGHPEAQYSIGCSFFSGPFLDNIYRRQALADEDNAEANVDNIEAVKWFIKSAKQGDICAQNALGNAYFYGTGVPQDYSLAFEWFRKSNSLFCLGEMYYYGYGVEKDEAEAVRCYRNDYSVSESERRLEEIGWNCNLWKKALGISKDDERKAELLYAKLIGDSE
ncbi:MAG: sel1 repeat family protein [Candidatus Scalindua sp.]|jgi:uncharacterized protein|nr:sel1 repeat family protein [Candidatus Scalindua sp.]